MVRRGRFAPTPSGPMHLGNAMTALLAWLQMQSVNGVLVLRIEDIDNQRFKTDYADQLMYDLRWLGLNWDEGPDNGGPFEPYTQSFRQSYYEEALQKLHENDWLYPCYCSRAELKSIAHAPHGLAAEGSAYPNGIVHFPSLLLDRQARALSSFSDGLLTGAASLIVQSPCSLTNSWNISAWHGLDVILLLSNKRLRSNLSGSSLNCKAYPSCQKLFP